MKPASLCAALVALVSVATVRAEPLKAEDFSHEAAYKDVNLSPDGALLSYAETVKGEHRIYLLDLATNKKIGLELLGNDKSFAQPTLSFWVNKKRFMYFVPRTGTYTVIDRDGRNGHSNIPGGALLYRFQDNAGRVLMNGIEMQSGTGMGGLVQFYYSGDRPFVQEVNPSTATGMAVGADADTAWAPTTRVVDNPGSVKAWVVDATGVVRAAKEIRGTRYRTLYRDSEDGSWGPLPGLDWPDAPSFPLGFSADGANLYVGQVTTDGTWGVFAYDLKTKRLGEPLLAHKKYDIVHPDHGGSSNGVGVSGLVYSPKERALLGIRYHTDYPHMLWLDAGMAEVQAALDQALVKHVNSVVSMSDDLQQLIVQSWSATDPGTYYRFDRRTQKLEKLLSRMPWIDPATMADTIAVRFKSRDGGMLNGYVTLPPGKGQQHLPVVVMPHNLLQGRHLWSFDPFVQFLASRGYAVLEVSPRGSTGFGEAYRTSANDHGIQQAVADCNDAVGWIVKQGIADPARIAIFGQGSLAGGYAYLALMGENQPYRCGVIDAGAADWSRTIEKTRLAPDGLKLMIEKFGDPQVQTAAFGEISALRHPDRIKVPVLITHDKDDRNDLAYNQSKEMAAALKAAGKPVEFINNYDEPYGYLTLAKYMNDTVAFLQKNMPAE